MAVDYRLMLSRLRPGSEYHWKGTSDTPTDQEAFDAIGEWRDPNTTKPTKAALDTEWVVYQQELTAAAATATAARADQLEFLGIKLTGHLADIAADLAEIDMDIPNAANARERRIMQRQQRLIRRQRLLINTIRTLLHP